MPRSGRVGLGLEPGRLEVGSRGLDAGDLRAGTTADCDEIPHLRPALSDWIDGKALSPTMALRIEKAWVSMDTLLRSKPGTTATPCASAPARSTSSATGEL